MSKKKTVKAILVPADDSLVACIAEECQRVGFRWPLNTNVEWFEFLFSLGFEREYIHKILTELGFGEGLDSDGLPPDYVSVKFPIHRLPEETFARVISTMSDRIKDSASRERFSEELTRRRSTDSHQSQFPLLAAEVLMRLRRLPSVKPATPAKPRLSVQLDPPEIKLGDKSFPLTRDQFDYLEPIVAAKGKPKGTKSELMPHPERIHLTLPQAIQEVIIVSNKGREIDTSKVDV